MIESVTSTPATPDISGAAEALGLLRRRIGLLVAGPLVVGLAALGATYLVAPVYTATATLIPPQPAQGTVSNALGSIAMLAGASAQSGTPERYVGLLQSQAIADTIVDAFDLIALYKADFRVQARRTLASNSRFSVGKKDGLIRLEVDDTDPQRAADIANRYITELRTLTHGLALSEAQQRRIYFEQLLRESRDRLAQAQRELETTGVGPGALKADPRSAVDAYAQLQAELTASQVRLATLRSRLSDRSFEVIRQEREIAALRSQLAAAEQATRRSGADGVDQDYVGRYREFKYQETLFELYARQFELARADESRESTLIQVVDPAVAPEVKSWPKRALTAIVSTVMTLLILVGWTLARHRAGRGP
jgi:uncharacterized protein involved in exopolysaccharide biosynthesis